MIITYGTMAIFFGIVIWILQRSFVSDKSFTDYAVAGRSFGGFYQAMSFLNTWYPGAVFVAFAGLSAGTGVLGFYPLTYSMLTMVVMYLISRRVWVWGSQFDFRTQPDLFALRYGSRIFVPSPPSSASFRPSLGSSLACRHWVSFFTRFRSAISGSGLQS